jgi:hypothetical protein
MLRLGGRRSARAGERQECPEEEGSDHHGEGPSCLTEPHAWKFLRAGESDDENPRRAWHLSVRYPTILTGGCSDFSELYQFLRAVIHTAKPVPTLDVAVCTGFDGTYRLVEGLL